MDLSTAVVVDLLVLTSCAAIVLSKGSAGHSHPAVIYLLFHSLVVTSRAYAIERGAPTFLSGVAGYSGATEAEIVRAVLYADMALAAATFGWMSSRKRPQKEGRRIECERDRNDWSGWRQLRWRPIRTVAIVSLPVGLLALLRFGFVPGLGTPSATSTSSYLTIAVTWPGLVLISLIYYRGFRASLLVPLSMYLLVIAIQGYGRFRFIVPLILLAQIYLDRRRRRWPDLRIGVVLVASLLLFFPLKQIGRAIQSGEDAGSIGSSTLDSVADAVAGQAGDQVILDQLALTLSLADESTRVFLGLPYLNVVTLPVPREVWENKPGLADHLRDISNPSRPLDTLGSVTTLSGDLYLNFRLPGMLLLMFVLARWSAQLYEAAYRRPYRSVGRFAFLLFSCNLIQIYRDGPIAVPVFVLVQMLPLVAILLLHWRRVPNKPATGSGRARATVELARHDEGVYPERPRD